MIRKYLALITSSWITIGISIHLIVHYSKEWWMIPVCSLLIMTAMINMVTLGFSLKNYFDEQKLKKAPNGDIFRQALKNFYAKNNK